MLRNFFYPLKFLYEGRAYFLLAALAFAIAEIIPEPPQTPPVPFLARVASEVLTWLPTLATLLLIAGIASAILSETLEALWEKHMGHSVTAGFQTIAEKVGFGLSHVTIDAVVAWLNRPNTDVTHYKKVAYAALRAHYGYPQAEEEESYLNFVFQNFLDRSASRSGITRENFSTNITLEKVLIAGQPMIKWIENRTYELVCPAEQGEDEAPFGTSSLAPPNVVNELAKSMVLTIKHGSTSSFELQKWMNKFGEIDFNKKPELVADGVTMNYDGTWLTVSLKQKIPMKRRNVTLSIREVSYISPEERFYYFMTDQPIHRMTLNMRLGNGLEDWILKKPVLSAQRYHHEAAQLARIDQPDLRTCEARTDQWVLPGIALVIEWHPKFPAKATD